MTYLALSDPNSVPAAYIVDGSPRTVMVNYGQVEQAVECARRAVQAAGDPAVAVKELADAVYSLSGLLAELVAGLHHGDVAVANYPVDGAHLPPA